MNPAPPATESMNPAKKKATMLIRMTLRVMSNSIFYDNKKPSREDVAASVGLSRKSFRIFPIG